ncbi:MAG: FtsX-like permease family protein [Gemmataceae bacterium]
MYILLLWGRYLKTRRLALLCVFSVMLGVATLIVVNSVMAGFSTKLKERMHALLSDIEVRATDPIAGFPIPADEMVRRIRESPVGKDIAAMSPTVETFALMQVEINGHSFPKQVMLEGVDPKLQQAVGGFPDHIVSPQRRANPSFDVDPEAMRRFKQLHPPLRPLAPAFSPLAADPNMPMLPPVSQAAPRPEAPRLPAMDAPPSPTAKYYGAIIGYAMAHRLNPKTKKEECWLPPGDTIKLITIGGNLEPVIDEFIVCDYFKSDMSDYDGSYVYVPLDYLQRLRNTEGRTNVIQIKLKHYETEHAQNVRDAIQNLFPEYTCTVATWEDKQGALLAAIEVERGILNVLLFMIIGVAGFGILAIFSMIVTEKTRDIGILKSLGASNGGVRNIFIGYGLLLGAVGSILGTGLGLLITYKINWIEQKLASVTGHQIFDRNIYYFNEIPTDVQPVNVALIVLGALVIAVAFSLLPAWRASRMRPVQALRFE